MEEEEGKGMSVTLLLRVGDRVPYSHHALGHVQVPSIKAGDVRKMLADPPADLASMHIPGDLREFLPGAGVTFWLNDGTRLHLPRELADLALAGGGEFTVAHPNLLHDQPITRERGEDIEREQAEMECRGSRPRWRRG
jgi:hypothetical protein